MFFPGESAGNCIPPFRICATAASRRQWNTSSEPTHTTPIITHRTQNPRIISGPLEAHVCGEDNCNGSTEAEVARSTVKEGGGGSKKPEAITGLMYAFVNERLELSNSRHLHSFMSLPFCIF
jgi:hypothetical protein